MTEEELFKKNFPEFVTEKGMCLSPFFDLFSAGIECATEELNKGCIQTLTKENAELKQQKEQMKCPQNCRYGSISVWCDDSISIDCEKEKYLHEDNWCDLCKSCKKWEIKENE